jgi:hypothetical protein
MDSVGAPLPIGEHRDSDRAFPPRTPPYRDDHRRAHDGSPPRTNSARSDRAVRRRLGLQPSFEDEQRGRDAYADIKPLRRAFGASFRARQLIVVF